MKRGMNAVATDFRTPERLVERDSDELRPTGGLTAALTELEETTARVVSLRHKVERLTVGIAERQDALGQLEHERASLRRAADHDLATIARLERDLESRELLFANLRSELAALAAELGVSGAKR